MARPWMPLNASPVNLAIRTATATMACSAIHSAAIACRSRFSGDRRANSRR
jgi:hypothetical protein